MRSYIKLCCISLVLFATYLQAYAFSRNRILVFGGNGFLGANTVERLVEQGDNVTIVNRGNWYWDSRDRILPRVTSIQCDRKENFSTCDELIKLVEATEKFDAIIDFSASNGPQMSDVFLLLQNQAKVGLYILISTDSIYDVCDKHHRGPSEETDGVRPKNDRQKLLLNTHNNYGHYKLEAEEVMVEQAKLVDIPYVILRLSDVMGPRDTTYRWWIYQLWVRIAEKFANKPVSLPAFLKHYQVSLVYVDDVTNAIVKLLSSDLEIQNEAINLAWPETFTVEEVIHDMQEALGVEKRDIIYEKDDEKNHFYLYPSVRNGPLDVAKAKRVLNWEPTPWKEAVRETVTFHENATKEEKYKTQRDEIIQIVGMELFPEGRDSFYDAMEEIYDIKLPHFKRPHDEL